MAKNVNLNLVCGTGLTPLMTSLDGTNNMEIKEYLLMKGADPDFSTENDWLPLHSAVELAVEAEDYGNTAFITTKEIELLIKYGANPNKQTKWKQTPYQMSINYNLQAQKLFEKFMNI